MYTLLSCIKNTYNFLLNFLEIKNISLFFYIFSLQKNNHGILRLSIFFCKNVIKIFPIILLLNWILYKKNRKAIIDTIFVLTISLLINFLFKKIIYFPRPFVSLIQDPLIDHISDSSFPSNHASLSLSISMNFMTTKTFKSQGVFLFIIGNIISLCRIHAGLHFPLDILGSFIISLQSILIKKLIKLKECKNRKSSLRRFL